MPSRPERGGAGAAHRIARLLAPLVALAVLGAAWQAVASRDASVLPPLGDVAAQLLTRPGFFAAQLAETLSSALLGLAAGAGGALVLASLMVHLPLLRAAVLPVAVLLNVTPVVAIAPALVVAFGFGRTPHVIVVALITAFPMLVGALAGLEAVDRAVLEVFRSLGASRWETFWRLRAPSALPYVFTALKVCTSLAVIGAVVSEFTGTTDGIGATIVASTTYLDLAQMWAAIAAAAAAALALLGAVTLLQSLAVRW